MKNKLKKMGKFIVHNLFGLIIGILIAGTTVYAATVISGSSISYDNSSSKLEATNVQDALDELTSKTYKCPGNSYNLCTHDIKVGDYVTSTNSTQPLPSYTIPASLTGYTSDQTINPSELRLWRIIDIKNDGTIDLVSEYTSSTPVYFKGLVGLQNLVGTLNLIASQYSNSAYSVIGTRYMGYAGQVGTISTTSLSKRNCTDRSGACTDAGDEYYKTDTNLVQSALGTLLAYKYGTTSSVDYWLASRYYVKAQAVDQWCGRIVNDSGNITYKTNLYSTTGAAINTNGIASYIRPIITIKADAYVTSAANSDGTSSKPWRLD